MTLTYRNSLWTLRKKLGILEGQTQQHVNCTLYNWMYTSQHCKDAVEKQTDEAKGI